MLISIFEMKGFENKSFKTKNEEFIDDIFQISNCISIDFLKYQRLFIYT